MDYYYSFALFLRMVLCIVCELRSYDGKHFFTFLVKLEF